MIRRRTKIIYIPKRIQELLMSDDTEMVSLGANCLFKYTKSKAIISKILEDFSYDIKYINAEYKMVYGNTVSHSTYSYLKRYWIWTIDKNSTISIKPIEEDYNSSWSTNYQYISSCRNKVHKREVKYPYKVYTFEEVEELPKNNFIKQINKSYEQKKFYKRPTWRKQAR